MPGALMPDRPRMTCDTLSRPFNRDLSIGADGRYSSNDKSRWFIVLSVPCAVKNYQTGDGLPLVHRDHREIEACYKSAGSLGLRSAAMPRPGMKYGAGHGDRRYRPLNQL